MAIVPKRKHSKSRRDKRRSANWKITPPGIVKCEKCGGARLPHRVCKLCGTYNGREYVKVEEEE